MKKVKRLPVAVFAASFFMVVTNQALAQVPVESTDGQYSFDQIVVSATRVQKHELDIPSTTSVYTSEQLVSTGASSVEEALRFTDGIVFKAETVGSGGGEFLIRGKRRGTLVLINGVSINFRTGYYDLSNIPIEDVERIEVIRGGGAVLYGSDTTGGVINIVMKKKRKNYFETSFGSYGKQKDSLSIQEGKLGIGFTYQKIGEINNVSAPSIASNRLDSKYFDFLGGEKYIYSLNYQFDPNWGIQLSHTDHHYRRRYNFANKNAVVPYDERDMNNTENRATLHFEKNGWKANAYYQDQGGDTTYTYYEYISKASATLKSILNRHYLYSTKDQKVGIDLQKEWKIGKDTIVGGIEAHRETYNQHTANGVTWNTNGTFKSYKAPTNIDYARSVYSYFGQWNHVFDKKNEITLSARQTWTGGSPDGTEYQAFTPQVQWLYKLNPQTSAYASYSQSFTLPTMTDMYGDDSAIPNPDIRPEKGTYYEVGLKHITKSHSWKLALFKSDVKDFITGGMDEQATNEDTKNLGVELTCEIAGKNGWSSNWGVSFSNPMFFTSDAPEKGWQRNYGRIQFNVGVRYHKDKWDASLQGNFLGDRVLQSYQTQVEPLFSTSLRLAYRPGKSDEIYLVIDNLLDRRDIISHVSSLYYALPRNFELGYKRKF
jgi:iron complex outermembrane receptor protein